MSDRQQLERAPNGHVKVTVRLTGEDGNVFAIVGRCHRAMRRADWTNDEIAAFDAAIMACHSYDEALAIVQDYCDDYSAADDDDDEDDDDSESESEFDTVYAAAPEGTLVGLCLRCGRAFADGEDHCPDCDRPQSAPDAEPSHDADYCHCCHADLTRETHRESCENAGPSGHISD